jgi:hypothetical protein
MWLASLIGADAGEPLRLCEAGWLPANLSFSRKAVSPDRLMRLWALAVRRHCWRTAKITVREIVTRRGLFSVDRAEIDVSLPLEEAEIRIRRVGLDLDPGWLPWFGRVVRFHYLYLSELYG